jgi:hypothetical protein
MNATTPTAAQKCLITDEILDIVRCTNQRILFTQPNYSHIILFTAQINVSLLLNLTTATKVMPNSQTKLR